MLRVPIPHSFELMYAITERLKTGILRENIFVLRHQTIQDDHRVKVRPRVLAAHKVTIGLQFSLQTIQVLLNASLVVSSLDRHLGRNLVLCGVVNIVDNRICKKRRRWESIVSINNDKS